MLINSYIKQEIIFVVIYFFGGIGVCTQGSVLVRQVLYHLSHSSGPFCFGYFGDRSRYFCSGQPSLLFSYFKLAIITELTGAHHHTHFYPLEWVL
jgi:hypothetical protein